MEMPLCSRHCYKQEFLQKESAARAHAYTSETEGNYLDRIILVSDIKWHENRETCAVLSSLLQEGAAMQ